MSFPGWMAWPRASASLSAVCNLSIGGAFKVAAVGAGVGIAALGAGLVKAVAAGSDVEEMMGKFNVVFANTGAMVTEQLDDFAGAVGRNKFELREMAATFGDTLKPMGFTEDAAAGLAVDLSKVGYRPGQLQQYADG
jgi:hypothetical protein